MDKKGQQAISAVLVSGILIGVVGSVYFWGIPLIQKSRDTSLLESAESLMSVMDGKIKSVAAGGGRENIRLTEPGILQFSGGSAAAGGTISYGIETDGTIYATGAEIPLGKSSNCDAKKAGDFGTDDSQVLCVSSVQLADLKYQNTYSLTYRNLTSGLKTYRIALTGVAGSGGKDSFLIIQNDGTTETTEGGSQVVTSGVRITID